MSIDMGWVAIFPPDEPPTPPLTSRFLTRCPELQNMSELEEGNIQNPAITTVYRSAEADPDVTDVFMKPCALSFVTKKLTVPEHLLADIEREGGYLFASDIKEYAGTRTVPDMYFISRFDEEPVFKREMLDKRKLDSCIADRCDFSITHVNEVYPYIKAEFYSDDTVRLSFNDRTIVTTKDAVKDVVNFEMMLRIKANKGESLMLEL